MLFENSPVGLALVDHMTGEFLEVNDAVLDAAGYTKDEFMSLSYWDITPREYEEQEIRQIEELNKTGSFGPNTKEYIRKDGTRYPISISGALYTEINGETVVWGIIEDITERKEAEETINRQNEELKYLNAAKDRFITLLAHDLKSPFTSILGILDLILHKYEHHSKEELLHYIHMMNTVSKNTYDMLEDILLWIKADSNNIEYSPSQLSCSSIYNEVIDIFVPIAESKKIKITRSLHYDSNVFADANMLKTILRNLISNAIKFTHEQGHIEISTNLKGNDLETTIKDSGVGIDKNRVEKLFKLEAINTTTGTSNEKGTGFGLLICKEFVEKHGGEIWVESEPDNGSEFKFTIPVLK
jgi:PAS domain S-box-containing protein